MKKTTKQWVRYQVEYRVNPCDEWVNDDCTRWGFKALKEARSVCKKLRKDDGDFEYRVVKVTVEVVE
jgi:hypothetical protein